MQQENQIFHEFVTHLQQNQASTTFGSTLKESRINLPETCNGTCSKFQGFVKHICFVIQLHEHYYPDDQTQVGLIGTLLLGTTLA
jgi:hypothetical protein